MTAGARGHASEKKTPNRVVLVAEDLSRVAGGVPAVVCQLSEKLVAHGLEVDVLYASGDGSALPDRVRACCSTPTRLRRSWNWGKDLTDTAADLARAESDAQTLFHLHGIWCAPQYFSAKAARSTGIPFVLSAHGMLEPWLWNSQGWRIALKKRVYWRVFAYPALKHAKIIHAITPLERDHLSVLFPDNRIELIPNAIDVPFAAQPRCLNRERKIVYLGRLEPKKGADILLSAFAASRIRREWTLEIAGPFWSEAYRRKLELIVCQSGLTPRVRFLGPVFGEAKQKLLESAWVMAVPSHSEVMGLVNLEAAIAELPTITTHQTGLCDWGDGGGMLVNPDEEDLRRAIEIACSWGEAERSERGWASRCLVDRCYSWPAVLPKWLALYDSLLEGRY